MKKKGIHLIPCPICNGAGESRGVFHLLTCIDCRGLGEVRSDNNEPIEDIQIIDRLRERNRKLLHRLEEIKRIERTPQLTDEEIKRKHYGARAV